MYNCCLIFLHQSELSKREYVDPDPKRVRSSKAICIKTAIEIAKLTDWKINNVPLIFRSNSITPWKMCGAVILLNLCFFKDRSNYGFNNSIYEDFLLGTLESYEHTITVEILFAILEISHSIKRNAFLKNRSFGSLREMMRKFSVASNDIDPWIVPRYATFFKFPCCIKSNYNTLNISEYLNSSKRKSNETSSQEENFSDSGSESDCMENVEFLSLHFSDVYLGQKSREKMPNHIIRDNRSNYSELSENCSTSNVSNSDTAVNLPKKQKCNGNSNNNVHCRSNEFE
ncbi:hypothetical protein AYI68_g2423 [Smittium mucronatum]|uniref:Uncharacterized protein n=1 Tax=Smittium mucronatum TaxID=133383 RepID=A0A1R0H2P0_9FUNG|nr:hypothetical protein AYI68_g2423 [Smittium mucronatum]